MKYIKYFESNVPNNYDELIKFRNDFKDKLYAVNSIDMGEIKEVILPLLDEIGEHEYTTTEYLTNEYVDIQINDSEDIDDTRFNLKKLNKFLIDKGLENVKAGWRVDFCIHAGKVIDDSDVISLDKNENIKKEFNYVKNRLYSMGYLCELKIKKSTMKIDGDWGDWNVIDIIISLIDFEPFDIEMSYHSKIPKNIIKDFDTFVRNKKLTEEDTEQLINMINKVRNSN